MNCKLKALMIINDAMQYEKFKNYFSKSEKIDADIKQLDGIEAEEFIMKNNNQYQIIFLDVHLQSRDGISIISNLYSKGYKNKFTLYSEYNTVLIKKITNIIPTIEFIFINPKYLEDIENTLLLIGRPEEQAESKSDLEIKTEISKQLHKLGMPAHIKGYQYIREGIFQMYTNSSNVTKITKDLYPMIAEMYNTTPSRVERAIRHSIEVSWSRGDYEVMESIFGNSVDFERSKPTNSEFISSVADSIILENKLRNSKRVQEINYN